MGLGDFSTTISYTGESVTVDRPASVSEVLQNGELLNQLDAGSPYPLQAEDFKSLGIELIGTDSLWAPRMKLLQESLSGGRSFVGALCGEQTTRIRFAVEYLVRWELGRRKRSVRRSARFQTDSG